MALQLLCQSVCQFKIWLNSKTDSWDGVPPPEIFEGSVIKPGLKISKGKNLLLSNKSVPSRKFTEYQTVIIIGINFIWWNSKWVFVILYDVFPSIVQDKSLPTETSQGRKPVYFHHCNILSKYSVLSFENLNRNLDVWLIFEIVHNIVTPFPIEVFFQLCTENTIKALRSAARGDCYILTRNSTFSQSAFSLKAIRECYKLPVRLKTCIHFHSFFTLC